MATKLEKMKSNLITSTHKVTPTFGHMIKLSETFNILGFYNYNCNYNIKSK